MSHAIALAVAEAHAAVACGYRRISTLMCAIRRLTSCRLMNGWYVQLQSQARMVLEMPKKC